MINLSDTQVTLVIVDIHPSCEIWVRNLTDEEQKTQFGGSRTLSFGLSSTQTPGLKSSFDRTPLYQLRSGQTCLMIDTTRDDTWEKFGTASREFEIVLPKGCSLTFNFLS